jgi:hypothetical protein
LQLVPLAGRDGARQGAPQDAVLGEDVHDLAVEADAGTLPGQRGADRDDLVGGSLRADAGAQRAARSRASVRTAAPCKIRRSVCAKQAAPLPLIVLTRKRKNHVCNSPGAGV